MEGDDWTPAGELAGEHGETPGDTVGNEVGDPPAAPLPAPAVRTHDATPAPTDGAAEPGGPGDQTPPGDGAHPDRVAALLAEGAGRRRLSRRLGITEYDARKLLDGTARNGHRAEATR